MLYLGYLGAGTTALALTALAIGESDGLLALRGVSALLAACLLRTYLVQAGQFDACADSLEPTDAGEPHPSFCNSSDRIESRWSNVSTAAASTTRGAPGTGPMKDG